MQYARPHDCRAKISKDFCAYIFESHIRIPSQCKKVGIHKLDEKIRSLREKFPKLDNCIFYTYCYIVKDVN